MSSFTDKLTVTKVSARMWEVERAFTYRLGSKEGEESVTVPKGFKTDFASVPRAFWQVLPPDGTYTQAAVVHDYLYYAQIFTRKKSDYVFLEAMGVLGVSWWKRRVMYTAVRLFGGLCWKGRTKPSKTNPEKPKTSN